MINTNRPFALLCIISVLCWHTFALAQPLISATRDENGTFNSFIAGQTEISEQAVELFHDVDNKMFSCALVQPLKAGDTIACQIGNDQAWSVTTVPLLIGTKNVQFPILASVTPPSAHRTSLRPALLKFKIDIKAGEVLHSDGLNGLGFDIETKRSVKAGDSIPVLFMDGGPSILSIEAADGANAGNQPCFAAYLADETPQERKAAIGAWRIYTVHVGVGSATVSHPVSIDNESPSTKAPIAIADLRAAALTGDTDAQFQLAGRYAAGNGIEKNCKEAANWYEKAANNGHADSAYNLATMYEYGIGVSADSSKAKHWYQVASQNGNTTAKQKLATLPTNLESAGSTNRASQ